ncbi:MAG: alpha/beta fold hydrolase, partial [Betaproteobacteria bacterium]
MKKLVTFMFAVVAVTLAGANEAAQVTERKVDLYSEGTRLGGTVFYVQPPEGEKLPAIIMSHGWGGTASMLRPQAERFANAGYFVLAFDYRGWGESNARWVRNEAESGAQTGRRELREVVHPVDQATDIANAVHWVMG